MAWQMRAGERKNILVLRSISSLLALGLRLVIEQYADVIKHDTLGKVSLSSLLAFCVVGQWIKQVTAFLK
jgi:hypothetical protein